MSRSVTVVLHERGAVALGVRGVRHLAGGPTHFLPSYAVNSGIDWPSRSCTRPAAHPERGHAPTRSRAGRWVGRGAAARRPATYVGNSVAVSGIRSHPDPDPAPDGEDEDIRTLVARLLEVVVKIAHDTGAIRTATELAAPRVHNIDVTASRLEDAFVAAKKAEKTRAATL